MLGLPTHPISLIADDAPDPRQSILATRQRHHPKNPRAAQRGVLSPSVRRQRGRRAAITTLGTQLSRSRSCGRVAKLSAVYQSTQGQGQWGKQLLRGIKDEVMCIVGFCRDGDFMGLILDNSMLSSHFIHFFFGVDVKTA